ncbi:unnamed protein product, partial [Rotaria sp. Silwood1]
APPPKPLLKNSPIPPADVPPKVGAAPKLPPAKKFGTAPKHGASAPSLPQPSLSSYGPSPQGFGGLVGAASFGGQGFKSLGVP